MIHWSNINIILIILTETVRKSVQTQLPSSPPLKVSSVNIRSRRKLLPQADSPSGCLPSPSTTAVESPCRQLLIETEACGKVPSQVQAQTPSSRPSSHHPSPLKSPSSGEPSVRAQYSRSCARRSLSASPLKKPSRGMLLVQLAQQKALTMSPASRHQGVTSKCAGALPTGRRGGRARRELQLEYRHEGGQGNSIVMTHE